MIWLHRIRTGGVKKGCGLKPVTSVAVAAPPHSERSAEEGGDADDTLLSGISKGSSFLGRMDSSYICFCLS